MKRIIYLVFLGLMIMSASAVFTQPHINFNELLTKAEKNPQIPIQAKMSAMEQGLPVNIYFPQGILIEALGLEKGQPVYGILTNPVHPFQGGQVAFFDEIQQMYDISSGKINYGNGVITNENLRIPKTDKSRLKSLDSLLLIPESSNDRVMAFDPQTGDLLDMDFIPPNSTVLSTPINAKLTPWGTISISDQIKDLVQEFDTTGSYIGYLAPVGGVNHDILDNMRGHTYKPDGHLLVTCAGGANQDAIVEFDSSGNYLGNFIANGAGGLNGPWDIWYREGDVLVTGGSSPEGIYRFDYNGAFLSIFSVDADFPHQLVELANGNVAVANWSSPSGVRIHAPDGTTLQLLTGVTGNRGVWELGNGNILTTNSDGVHELDRDTGVLVRTIVSGVAARLISIYVKPSGDLPGFFVTPQSINFGTIPVDSSKTDSVMVINTGNVVLDISSISSDHSMFMVNPNSTAIAPNDSQRIYITFTPTTIGQQLGHIIFTHNGPTSPDSVMVQGEGSGIGISNNEKFISEMYELYPNYPNPFSQQTIISYSLPKTSNVKIMIYNIKGELVKTLIDRPMPAGIHTVDWNVEDMSSGIYFYKFEANDKVFIKKMILMR